MAGERNFFISWKSSISCFHLQAS